MRLTSIELENFRCFEKEKIELHPQLNVFVGVNASGKTALLEGIGLGLAFFFQGLEKEGVQQYYIQESDQRQEFLNSVAIKHRPIIHCIGMAFGESRHSWERKFGVAQLPPRSEFLSDRNALMSDIGNGLLMDVNAMARHHYNGLNVEFPILFYFSTQRLWGGEGEVNIPNRSSIFSGYFNALNRDSNTLLFEEELERMQLVASQAKEFGFTHDSGRLDLIRSLAAKVIVDCKIFYYDYEKQSLAVIFNDGRRLTIDELSDGQKSLLLISTGIAFQCATLNPHMGLDAYKSNGVVLIDEVELHLHPDWQRQILPILTQAFPNIQFICTTHSPQVISSLKPENVQLIKDFKVSPLTKHTKGRDSNTILTEIFGIEKRPKEFADKLQHFYTLLETQSVKEAEVAFEELESLWGTMDTEIVHARMFLEDLYDDLARAKEVSR
ncbi:MAG: AAA family ATPase [Bacteroidetes bacterium]|nr:AAA family ATPase [Bacteroidota bacterium]